MTTNALLEYEITEVGNQIEACLKGLPEPGMDMKSGPTGMTPREILEHLGEAYQAVATVRAGGKHEWGSFRIEDKSTENLLRVYREKRAAAVGSVLNGDDDEAHKVAYDYIIGHDNYHVSHLVASRLQAEPDWNPYSIYG